MNAAKSQQSVLLLASLLLLGQAGLLQGRAQKHREENVGLDFLILGDWGGTPYEPYVTPVQVNVATMMGKTAANVMAKFVVALGDNFYFDGVKNDQDFRFSRTFEEVYTDKSLQIPWYVIAGNHDHHRNVSGEIDYTRLSKRWNFPDYYHTHVFSIPGTSKTLQIVLIDTILLCGNSGDDRDPKLLQGPDSPKIAADQLEWIEKTLSESKADYVLVGGHYPVWSISHHGPTQQLVDQLKPLLEKFQVNAYICGHDHNSQFIKESNSTVGYHVIGNAAYLDPRTTHESDVPEGSSKFFYYDEGSFAAVHVNDTEMGIRFISSQGKVLYEVASLPRKRS